MIKVTEKQTACVKMCVEKLGTMMKVEALDEETIRMVERIVVLRISTKHINLWMRQLEMKRQEMIELAGLMELDEIKKEISNAKSLESWGRRATNNFAKKVKRMLYEEIDNIIWSGKEEEVTQWCKTIKCMTK